MRRLGLLLCAVAIASCNTVFVDTYDACQISATLSDPAAAPGTVVRLTGGPQTTTWDTLVQVNGALAEVVAVDQSGDCSACAECRDAATDCGSCDADCADCVETADFVVPETAAGETAVVLTNAYGSTGGVPFEVLAGAVPPDTGDSGADTDVPTDTDIPIDTAPTTDTGAPPDTADTGAPPADTGADTGAPPPADTGPDTGSSTN